MPSVSIFGEANEELGIAMRRVRTSRQPKLYIVNGTWYMPSFLNFVSVLVIMVVTHLHVLEDSNGIVGE